MTGEAKADGGDLAAPRGSRRRPAAVLAVVILLLAILGLCWTSVGMLVAPAIPGGSRAFSVLALLLTVVPLAILSLAMTRRYYPGAAVRLLVFRPFWYAQFVVLFLTPVALTGALAGAPFGRAAETGRVLVLAVGTVFAALLVAGYFGSRRLELRRFVAELPGLPPALEGLRLVQISDLHVGPHTPRRHLEAVRSAVVEAAPDLIAVTGDLVDDYPGDVDCYAEALGGLRAPLGVFAVPGNHEVYSGWGAMREHLARLPLTLLVNGSVAVERDGQRFALVGTGDPAGGSSEVGPDLARAFATVPAGSFVVALAHNPGLWPALAARGVPLTLSGHTHWGQLAIPRFGWCLASPFLSLAMGWHATESALLYIHPGSNYWGLPFRLGTPAQVAVISLRRGERPVLREERPDA